jgi:hypothetical protein
MTPTHWVYLIPPVSIHNLSRFAVAPALAILPVHSSSRRFRSGGLRPSTSTIVPADGRFPRLLQRYLTGLIREREGEVVP